MRKAEFIILLLLLTSCGINKKTIISNLKGIMNKKTKTEVRVYYKVNNKRKFIIVDMETKEEVVAFGIDTDKNSLNCIQRALFASSLVGKEPTVVIIDTDGVMGEYEHRIKEACKKAGIKILVLYDTHIREMIQGNDD